MKHSPKIKAAIIIAALLGVIFCAKNAESEQAKPVDKTAIDGKPAERILQSDPCSLIVVECPNEESEQAEFAVISEMIAGTGFEGMEQAILDATSTYGVNVGLLIGIANAESSVGLRCKWNNCFGIMRQGHELRSYDTLAEGIMDAARYLREKHHNKGRFTPEEIMHSYVGHDAPWWIKNVYKYYQ